MSTVEALRTPEERFANLPDFPYAPRYVDALSGHEGLRAHYLDLGPQDADRTFSPFIESSFCVSSSVSL